jgi:diguanylate cyclase (GGDEF)-like protein
MLLSGVSRRLLALLVPEGVIVLVATAVLHWNAVARPVAPFVPVYPYLVLAVGLALAWRVGRSRVLFALVGLALADRALVWSRAGGGIGLVPDAVHQAVALLLPVNLVVWALLPERGVLTPSGARRAIALVVQVGLVLLLARPDEAEVAGMLQTRVLPSGLTGWTPLGDPALLAFAGGIVLLAILIVRRPNATARGFLWALVAALVALSTAPGPTPAGILPVTFLFATAGLVLVTALIEASYAMAYKDALTGLPGRRALDEALHRLDGAFAMAMVDVDHFKAFNDRFGHDVGDQVLRMVAGVLERAAGGGRAFRYGGEEFSLLFPGKRADQVQPAIEEVRAAVERTAFTLRAADRPKQKPKQPRRRPHAERVTITVSIGIADRTGRETPPRTVLKAADEALYAAKRAGRNRTITAGARATRRKKR